MTTFQPLELGTTTGVGDLVGPQFSVAIGYLECKVVQDFIHPPRDYVCEVPSDFEKSQCSLGPI